MSEQSGNKYVRMAMSIFTTGGAFGINLLIQLFITPYITKTVGTDAYGFVSLAKNFAQYTMIITIALNAFASRYIAMYYHEDNIHGAQTFFASAFFGDLVVGTVLAGIAGIAILFLEHFLHIPQHLIHDVKLLFAFVFLNFWIVTVCTAFEASGYVKDKLSLVGIIKGISYLAEAVTLILLFRFMKAKVYYVGIGLVVMSLVMAAGNQYICRKYTPELKVDRNRFSMDAVKKLISGGVWTSVNSLGETLNNGLDLVICDLMLTPQSMGQVAIAKTVHSMFHGLFIIVAPAFHPMFIKSYARNEKQVFMDELRLAMKVSGMVGNIAFAGFMALGLAFYSMWIPNEDIHYIYRLTLINGLTFIASGPMQPLYYIYTLTMKNRVPCLITVTSGFLNVASMYLMLKYTNIGAYIVVWTTVIVILIMNFITNPLYMAHVLKAPWYTFYPSIARNVLSCGIMALLFRLLSKLYTPHTWAGLALSAILYAVLGATMHTFIVCNRKERAMIKDSVCKPRADEVVRG